MGIEAFCPNGHRMKVKDHLAGRLGVCPTCGSRFRLPEASGEQPPHPDSPTVPATLPLPLAEMLAIDTAVISTLPIAVPYRDATRPTDTTPPAAIAAAATPPAPAPPTTAIRTAVPLGQVPLGQVPLGQVPPGAVPSHTGAAGPWSPGIGSPGGSLPADPVVDWTSSPRSPSSIRSPRVSRRKPRGDGGMGLSLALLAIAVIAAAVAWMILQSRGLR